MPWAQGNTVHHDFKLYTAGWYELSEIIVGFMGYVQNVQPDFALLFIWMIHFTTDWITAQKKLSWNVLQNTMSSHIWCTVLQTEGFPPCFINRKSLCNSPHPSKSFCQSRLPFILNAFTGFWSTAYFLYSHCVWYSCGVVCHIRMFISNGVCFLRISVE